MSSLKFWYFGVLVIVNAVFGDPIRDEKFFNDRNVTTKFYMANSKNQGYFYEINSNSLSNPTNQCRKGFKNEEHLIIMVHGFSRTRHEKWINKMKTEFTKKPNVNVIAINWRAVNCLIPAITVFENTRVYKCAYDQIETVAYQSAKFLDQLTCHYGNWTNIHILGHSMGAHIAGQIADRLKKNYGITVNRITGLDPALPRFKKTTSDLSLRDSHADFVDVIHTNSLPEDDSTFGLYREQGHIDIYPNGGDNQPGCPRNDSDQTWLGWITDYVKLPGEPLKTWISDGVIGESYPKLATNLLGYRNYLLCNHFYAPEYMTLSMTNDNCKYWAVPIAMKGQFVDCEKKGSPCVQMGINAKKNSKSGGQYYIDMNAMKQECLPQNVQDIYGNV